MGRPHARRPRSAAFSAFHVGAIARLDAPLGWRVEPIERARPAQRDQTTAEPGAGDADAEHVPDVPEPDRAAVHLMLLISADNLRHPGDPREVRAMVTAGVRAFLHGYEKGP